MQSPHSESRWLPRASLAVVLLLGMAAWAVAEDPPPIVLLYHNDAEVRAEAIRRLAAENDPELIDDLIRAESVEFYSPVLGAYNEALLGLTDMRSSPPDVNWKGWLAGEIEANRRKLDYVRIDPEEVDDTLREGLQPLALQLGPERFDEMAERLLPPGEADLDYEALRYMVANDHLPEVREFLETDWLSRALARNNVNINSLAYVLNRLAEPGPLRDKINQALIGCLESDDSTIVANALHMIAGVEGFATLFHVPDAEPHVRKHLDSTVVEVAQQARRALDRIAPAPIDLDVSYAEAFQDLYDTLGSEYPYFSLKDIDWEAVGDELLPRAELVENDDQFGALCLELLARLEDSHASISPAEVALPDMPFPRWDAGFACLLDETDKPVVYYVGSEGPAENLGVEVGMTVLAIDGVPARDVMHSWMDGISRYVGFSSERYLRYQAARMFCRQLDEGKVIKVEFARHGGDTLTRELPCTMGVRYLPRLPVPQAGIVDSANVSWIMRDGQVGYIYVRRIGADLIDELDRAVDELRDARAIIVDVRGNSGGGFDSARAHRNFADDDPEELDRPRFHGPMALLLDARCISAGEGWASWFVAEQRAKTFGEATAGASSRKRNYTLKNGYYSVTFSVKAYRGSLDRPIERRGLEPDFPLRQTATDLVAGRDSILEAASEYLRRNSEP